jgi:hypothetical protein
VDPPGVLNIEQRIRIQNDQIGRPQRR